MRIGVTGRHGQLAQSMLEAAGSRSNQIEVIPLSRPDFDLAHIENLAPALDRLAPDVIVNAAAFTAVDAAETDTDAALLINGAAAGALAAAAARLHIPIIQISTDYVFDGSKAGPYIETDPACPINVYGASKTLGEQLVASANPRHLILRTSWVISPFGQNFVKTMLRLAAEHDHLNVVDDQHGAPTYAPHLAVAVLTLAEVMASATADDPRWGIYHVANRGEATWCGVARETFARAASHGVPVPEVLPIPSSGYPTPARRPANSRLDCTKLAANFGVSLPAWQNGVHHCVDRLMSAQG